ncbi:MAG: tripartite tricarboxylate transporter substrate binding protein [Ottowia sp.]|uniref:Bug family tripartite tricarboxylate transporter substrate binding protein n=1 Tax=Ottowia sp. TaxID=1898956 RepID=UPI003C732D8D
MQRRTFIQTLTAAAAAPLSLAARASGYPSQPIRIYGGFGPGSTTDVLTRLMAPSLGQILGQPIVVDNIQGAAGNIAANTVARAKPDGYTLLTATSSMLGTNPHLIPQSGIQLDTFVPIAMLCNIGLVVVAGPSAPASTLAGVLEASHRQGLNYGTPGAGTPMHLIGELLRERSKGNLTHVPYKGGAAMIQDLASGQIPIGIVAYTPAAGLIKSGKLKPLAVCGTTRLAALPQVPTVPEIVPGVNIGAWCALMAPTGTPEAICKQLAVASDKALALPKTLEQLIELGCDRLTGDADKVRQLTKVEYDLSGDLIRRLNIRAG